MLHPNGPHCQVGPFSSMKTRRCFCPLQFRGAPVAPWMPVVTLSPRVRPCRLLSLGLAHWALKLALADQTWALQGIASCLFSLSVDCERLQYPEVCIEKGLQDQRAVTFHPLNPSSCATKKSQYYRSPMFLAVRRAAILKSFGTQTHIVPHISAWVAGVIGPIHSAPLPLLCQCIVVLEFNGSVRFPAIVRMIPTIKHSAP